MFSFVVNNVYSDDTDIKAILTLNRKLHKMVKHTQTIRRQKPTNCLSVFDHFVGLTFKRLSGMKN